MKNLSRLIPPLTIALLILGIAGCEPSEKMGGMTPDKRPPSGGAIGAYEGDVIDFAYSGGATGFADVNPSPGWPTPTSTDTAIPTSTLDFGAIEQLLRAEIVRDYLKSKEHAGAVIGFSIAAGYPGIVGGAVLGMTVQPQPLSQQRERISE
jgi:hypothetical protein